MIYDGNDWLKALLGKMEQDIVDIKKDVKELNEAKWMISGGKLVLNVLFSLATTAIFFYFKTK